MICVLSGGTGGAKFVDGLRLVMPSEEITLIVNTGDDLMWWGLYVSPDIDSITYVLSGMLSRERGWGVKGDTFLCLQAMGHLGEPTWFHTGDRDLAVHLLRSRLLAEGKSLSEATAVICGNDQLAFGALIECYRQGIVVPDQVSIVGFDDLEFASQILPTLTTIRVPAEEIGRRAAAFLVDRLNGLASPMTTEVAVSLVVRGSSGPPPASAVAVGVT